MPTNVDVASLHLKVTSSGLKKAKAGLDGVTRSAHSTEKSAGGLSSGFKKLAVQVLAVYTAMQSMSQLVAVNRQFSILEGQLKTVTGDLLSAKGAFQFLSDFASKTPYDLQQVTTAFVKLRTLGLSSSERYLKSYGNTAAAMGKDLNQLVEAVADATTNEFERLKEFGIKTKTEGDRITFTFRGVSTTIGKSAGEIEDYLLRIGEADFSSAMSDRMSTLDGLLSNLADNWQLLYRSIYNSGVGKFIETSIGRANEVLVSMIGFLDTKAVVGIKGFIDQVRALYDFFDSGMTPIRNFFIDIYNSISSNYSDVLSFLKKMFFGFIRTLIDGIKYFPQNLKAIVSLVKVEFKSLHAHLLSNFTSLAEGLKLRAGLVLEFIGVIGSKLKSLLTRDKDIDVVMRVQALMETYSVKMAARDEEALSIAEKINYARKEAIQLILDERSASISEYEFTQQMRRDEIKHLKFREEAAFKKIDLNRIESESNRKLAEEEAAIRQKRLEYAGQFFDDLATVALVAAGRQSSVFKQLAIVQATIKTYESATSAYASMVGIPYVGPAMAVAAAAAAIAAGFANIRAIKSVNYSGAYDSGGYISSGQVGLVGERGPELVSGPAQVTSRAQTSNSMKQTKTSISVMNFFDEVTFKAMVSKEIAANKDVIINIINTESKERRI